MILQNAQIVQIARRGPPMLMYRAISFSWLGLLASAAFCAAQPNAPLPHDLRSPMGAMPKARPATPPTLLDYVQPKFRDAVSHVLKQATLSTKATDDTFQAHPSVYDWLLDHPDRASLAWRRLNIPCLEIQELAPGKFAWKDPEHGSELTWELVGKIPDGMIWYASGKVKPGALLPTVPVKAVAVLHAPRTPVEGRVGVAEFVPKVQIYMQSDSRPAQAMLRILGPAGPRMAEQGAEQLLLFFSGPARYIYRHPEELATLLAAAPANPVLKK